MHVLRSFYRASEGITTINYLLLPSPFRNVEISDNYESPHSIVQQCSCIRDIFVKNVEKAYYRFVISYVKLLAPEINIIFTNASRNVGIISSRKHRTYIYDSRDEIYLQPRT